MSRKVSTDYTRAIAERAHRLDTLAGRIDRAAHGGDADPVRLQRAADDFAEDMACLGYDIMRWALGEGLEVPSAIAVVARHARQAPSEGQGEAAPVSH